MTRCEWWLPPLWLAVLLPVAGLDAAEPRSGELVVTAGRSLIVDTPVDLRRVSVANGDLAEALAVNPREVLINGKAAGETSVIIWQQDGTRILYDLSIRPNTVRVDAVRRQIQRELPGQDLSVDLENDAVFLHGRVANLMDAARAANMAATLGKVVNLLRVDTPPAESQILLKVRFADVDRSATSALGANLLSTGAANTIGQVTTGQFGPAMPALQNGAVQFTFSDALNVFLFRKDLNLGTLIRALQSKQLLEMLAEPNVLAIDGKPASFVAGGEFPFPVVQGGASVGTVTIQFREYGVRINFLPQVTPRGTIRLQVAPEVSSLDYANALQFQGYTIPALATRRVETEVELESGQSFVIAGLLDNHFTDTINKIPGLGDIPLLGKIFQSRSRTRNNSELMVLITPELVRPIPAGAAPPTIPIPEAFLPSGLVDPPRHPGADLNGPVVPPPVRKTMPVEQLQELEKQKQTVAPFMTGGASQSGASASSGAPGTGGR